MLEDEEGEIVSGTIEWNVRYEVTLLSYANFDFRLKETVLGKRGEVTVGYAVVQEAFSATVEVILMREGGDLPEKVHGKIIAIQDIEGMLPLSLFYKSKDDAMSLRSYDNAILLTRSVVVAPATEFRISATLYDNSGQIVKGCAKFHPKFGTKRQNIKTKLIPHSKMPCGEKNLVSQYELEVSVTFY
ncbi:unnamed protein product [Cuscuta campestris]|uniref:DUF6598 domain-containing protein n=2 Tax=Cuscuta sect. Cleistogrammica TaxID=1824901 RepID=A0A484L9Y2_9ASTE|nr:hypothetical protein DM860_003363 [Cuscuta australis]VFQ73064.1 unnamed protein product [Cuscuta campestris]